MISRVLVILGSETTPSQQGRMSQSARSAVAVARLRFGEFDAATITPDAAASRYALAAGAEGAACASVEELQTAEREVTLLGGDLGEDDLLAARLAESWQAALIFDVLDIEPDGKSLRVIRDCGRGAREILSVTGPAVLVISPESPVRLYVSQHRRLSVSHARLNATSAQASTTVKWEPAQPRAKTGNLAAKNRVAAGDRMLDAFGIGAGESASETSQQIVEADPRTCAEHLLRYLAHHGMLSRHRISAQLLDAVSPAGTAKSQPGDVASLSTARFTQDRPLDRRIERGPRAIEGQTVGLSRRPREVQSPANSTQSLPRPVARRPRGMDDNFTRTRRGPRPAIAPDTTPKTSSTN